MTPPDFCGEKPAADYPIGFLPMPSAEIRFGRHGPNPSRRPL
jgi:hypothetical protein